MFYTVCGRSFRIASSRYIRTRTESDGRRSRLLKIKIAREFTREKLYVTHGLRSACSEGIKDFQISKTHGHRIRRTPFCRPSSRGLFYGFSLRFFLSHGVRPSGKRCKSDRTKKPVVFDKSDHVRDRACVRSIVYDQTFRLQPSPVVVTHVNSPDLSSSWTATEVSVRTWSNDRANLARGTSSRTDVS